MIISKSNQQRKRRGGRRKRNTRRVGGIIPHPPAIQGYQVVHSTVLRYTVQTAVTALAITFNNLLDTINIATTAILASRLFRFVKVSRLRMWVMPSIGTSETCTVIFNGNTLGQQGDFIAHTDSSMGVEPAFLDVAPNRKALVSDFQPASSNTAFTLWLPVGAVIDCHLVFKGAVDGIGVAVLNAPIGATAGATYWRGLDGQQTASSDFVVPLGISQD